MDVYRIYPTSSCCNGSACVAANTKEEAINTFREVNYRKFEYDEGECNCNRIANMSYDIDKPFVIFDDLYLK